MRSTAAPYTESRLTRSVANERVGFPVVEQYICQKAKGKPVVKVPSHVKQLSLNHVCKIGLRRRRKEKLKDVETTEVRLV